MLRHIWWLACAALVINGCAGSGFSHQEFQSDLTDDRYDKALLQLESFSEHDVSALLDRGLILQAKGLYRESNEAFESAERRIADLYTRSLSKEALALLTNDRALDYRASGFEHAYIAYYRAWNYLELGLVDDVLVEARRINERLTFRSSSCEDIDGACGHDVFLRYFSGLLFEWAGEDNDAYVAYVQADAARSSSELLYGTVAPRDLAVRLVQVAKRLGFTDEAAAYAEAYGMDFNRVTPRSSSVVVFWENGLIGHREQVNLVIPIFKGERELIREDQEAWSKRLSTRRYDSYDRVKVDYLLPVSLPTYVAEPPVAAEARFHLGTHTQDTRSAAELSAMASVALDQAMPGILVRAIGRGLVKYFASEAAEDNFGEALGILVNLVGIAFEQADTRSWRSLPYQVHAATVTVPPGTYEGKLKVYSGEEKTLIEEADYETIEVPEGGIVFLRHRTD